MISIFKRDRTSRLRAIRAYLLIVLICTLLLFAFSVVSLHEQRKKANALSSFNIRFVGEQIASDLERRMQLLAADCLRSDVLDQLDLSNSHEASLKRLRGYRVQFDGLRKLHPIAQHFFVFKGNRLVFPLIEAPGSGSPWSYAAPGSSPDLEEYLKRLNEGERFELIQKKPAAAAESYLAAETLATTDRLRAIALSRAAGALDKAARKQAALQTYERLLGSYGDLYDESQTPFILALATGREEWATQLFRSGRHSLQDVYRNLIDGKWELSADQVESSLSRLERQLNIASSHRYSSDYLDHFQMAKAINEDLKISSFDPPMTVTAQAIRYKETPYQVYQVTLPDTKNGRITVGFSVSMSWLNESLVPTYARESSYSSIRTASLVEASQVPQARREPGDAYASFQSILPFWRLHITADSSDVQRSQTNREIWFIGLSVLMFLMVLSLGLFLFMRVSWDIRAFQLRSDFVSGVSHEFKTPLSLIRLYSETLAADDQDFPPEDRKNYIRIIARESERLSRLINNVLDFTKLEQRTRRPALPEGNLGETIAQAIQDYGDYLMWRGFELKSSIQPDLPPVRFNPEQVSQMIINLLDNARKYSGSGRLIRINAWAQANEVVIEVQDNGIGIAAEEKERIFQPFYRIANTDEKGGCGLGLYLVAQVMEEHKGRVEVESQLNQGSRFRLVFPISRSGNASATMKQHELIERVSAEPQSDKLA